MSRLPWTRTPGMPVSAAARELGAELDHPLSLLVGQALDALERRPMARRIADAARAAEAPVRDDRGSGGARPSDRGATGA